MLKFLAGYIKHLILKEVSDMEYPEYEPSERTIKAYKNSLREKKEGKLIEVTDLDKFFKEL